MSLAYLKIKITKNRTGKSEDTPDFTLSYNVPSKNRTSAIYEIISAFSQGKDIIMELNTSWFSIPARDKRSFVSEFLEYIKGLGLTYRCRSIEGYRSKAVLESLANLFIKRQPPNDTEIFIYIPSDIWENDEVKKILPIYCTRFYFTEACSDPFSTLDNMMFRMSAQEKLKMGMTITSSGLLSSMGICCKSLSSEDLKKLCK